MDRQLRLLVSLLAVGVAAMLIGATGQQEHSYYVLLRLVVCFAAAATAALGLRWRRPWAVGVFAFLALLFNPIAPLELSKDYWSVIDIFAAILFLAVVPSLGFPTIVGQMAARLKQSWKFVALALGGITTIALVVLYVGQTDNLRFPWQSTPTATPTQQERAEALLERLRKLRALTPTPTPTPVPVPADVAPQLTESQVIQLVFHGRANPYNCTTSYEYFVVGNPEVRAWWTVRCVENGQLKLYIVDDRTGVVSTPTPTP